MAVERALSGATWRAVAPPFRDLDRLLEKSERTQNVEIFAQKGEAYFRQLESELSPRCCKQTVRSSRPARHRHGRRESKPAARKSVVIGLSASVDALLARVEAPPNGRS